MLGITEIIDLIVQDVRAEWDATEGKRPFYEYGHPNEIFGRLSEKDQNETFKYDKYPVICLYLDTEESNTKTEDSVQDLTIVIITETDPNSDSPNRYDDNFKPTLLPIYRLFLKYLWRSKYLASDDDYLHKKFNRFYYGKVDEYGNSGDIGNDALDALVISGLNLRLINCK